MAHEDLCCGLYRGRFYLKDLSTPNSPLLPVGNAEATISQTLTEITQPNYQSLGGSACKVEFVESVSLDLVLHCTNPKNMALAFLGESSQTTDTLIEGEEHAVNGIGELIAFNRVPDRTQTIIVTSQDDETTYTEGEDYTLTGAGIVIVPDSSILTDGSVIKVTYTHGANYILDAQTVGQKEFQVVLDGFNAGQAGDRPVVLRAWKVKFAPTDSFALISGTEFASLNLSGEILRDDSVVSGSKFFNVEWGIEADQVY